MNQAVLLIQKAEKRSADEKSEVEVCKKEMLDEKSEQESTKKPDALDGKSAQVAKAMFQEASQESGFVDLNKKNVTKKESKKDEKSLGSKVHASEKPLITAEKKAHLLHAILSSFFEKECEFVQGNQQIILMRFSVLLHEINKTYSGSEIGKFFSGMKLTFNRNFMAHCVYQLSFDEVSELYEQLSLIKNESSVLTVFSMSNDFIEICCKKALSLIGLSEDLLITDAVFGKLHGYINQNNRNDIKNRLQRMIDIQQTFIEIQELLEMNDEMDFFTPHESYQVAVLLIEASEHAKRLNQIFPKIHTAILNLAARDFRNRFSHVVCPCMPSAENLIDNDLAWIDELDLETNMTNLKIKKSILLDTINAFDKDDSATKDLMGALGILEPKKSKALLSKQSKSKMKVI